jgi:hypothetical protein
MVLRAIYSDQQLVIDSVKGLQVAQLIQCRDDALKHRKYPLRRHGIQQITNMIVCGNVLNAKQGLGIVFALCLGHSGLVSEKRRALGEKHRECP